MKAKTNMEGKYIKKCAEVSVAQTQKRCNMSEKEMKDEIEVIFFFHLILYPSFWTDIHFTNKDL